MMNIEKLTTSLQFIGAALALPAGAAGVYSAYTLTHRRVGRNSLPFADRRIRMGHDSRRLSQRGGS
jgi:threonine/homoserine efflux transporter RhtA